MAAVSTIPMLVYRDVAAAHDQLVDVFGFDAGRVDRSPDGTPVHAEVSIAGLTIWLHRVAPDHGYTSPADLRGETAGLCIEVDDARAHHARAEAAGLTVLSAPVNQPYGFTEYVCTDLDSRRWTFISRLPG